MHKRETQFLALDFLLSWFIVQDKWEIEYTRISYLNNLELDTEVCDI